MKSTFLDDMDTKSAALKMKILGMCIDKGSHSIAKFSDSLGASVPTITKLVMELIEDGYLLDLGKMGTSGGRRPSIYGLNPKAGFFVGVDCGHHHINFALINFKGELLNYEKDVPYELTANEDSYDGFCVAIKDYVKRMNIKWEEIRALGISLRSRVNFKTGASYSYFGDNELPFNAIFEKKLGIPVITENDSRAMAYGEYLNGVVENEKNVLFLNGSWGLGMGIILDGRPYYGRSGFSGEIGHVPLLDNDLRCRCGKIGCLETGASGLALHREVISKLAEGRSSVLSDKYRFGEDIRLRDILKAIENEDMLCIEELQKVGELLGRGLAGVINLFNPELLVLGGRLMVGREYLLLTMQSAIKKYSLNMVNKDTAIKFSSLGRKAAPLGASLIARSHFLGLI